LSLAVAVPSAPAGIDTFEAVTMAFLSHTSGVGYEAGLAAATVLHAVISLPQLLLCLPLLCSGVTPRTEVPRTGTIRAWQNSTPCKLDQAPARKPSSSPREQTKSLDRMVDWDGVFSFPGSASSSSKWCNE
jgi:hypothetical protein